MGNKKEKFRVLLLGPDINAVSGVSTHIIQILNSDLSRKFVLDHFRVGSQGRNENLLGKIARIFYSPVQLYFKLLFFRPHIIHLNTSLEWKSFWRDYMYLLVAKLLSVEIVYQIHGGDLPAFVDRHKKWEKYIKNVFEMPKAIISISTIESDRYSKFAVLKKIFYVPNAIDLDVFDERNCENNKTDIIKLMFIGRLAEDKGVFEIINAIDILNNQKNEFLFDVKIAGSGPEEVALKEKVNQLGLQDKVHFVGSVFGEKKTQLLCESDIFLFPTFHEEGLPYSILESLAAGTLVITTRIGGNIDVLREGIEGFFIESRNAEMLASKISFCCNNKDLISTMSAKCKLRANENYGINRMVEQFKEVYEYAAN